MPQHDYCQHHARAVPRAADGTEFYHSVVRFADGVAAKMPPKRAPAELKVVNDRKSRRPTTAISRFDFCL
jgi:hypothetical protein